MQTAVKPQFVLGGQSEAVAGLCLGQPAELPRQRAVDVVGREGGVQIRKGPLRDVLGSVVFHTKRLNAFIFRLNFVVGLWCVRRHLRPACHFRSVIPQPNYVWQQLQPTHCGRELWVWVFRSYPIQPDRLVRRPAPCPVFVIGGRIGFVGVINCGFHTGAFGANRS